ncbi:MAG TPA: type II secretion system F family protein [Candidatus Dormibacteraeota bacterium]|nr:type II secretion system F family protein [Candidatus Dormibacteraeota bacterium]
MAALAGAGVAVLYWSLTSSARPAAAAPEEFYAPPPPEPARRQRLDARAGLLGPLSALLRPFISAERDLRMQTELNRAGLQLRAQEFLLMQVGVAVVLGLLLFWRFGNPLFGVAGLAAGYFLPVFYLHRRQRKRKQGFERQLGDMVGLMSNGIKAGYSIQQALASVVESARDPLREEMSRVVRETSLGLPLEDALQHANDRLESKDFDLMVTAILIHRTVGGNLAEVLDKISETIRERVKVQGEVRVLTAQARASGYIITGLPFAVAGILSLISPGFERPLFTHFLGWVMIVLALFMIGVGYAIIRKITDIHL